MAAPESTVWGSIVGSYGKIGIYKSLTNTETTTKVTVEVWVWTKYSCIDTANTLYFDNLSSSGSATTSQGSVSINTTSDSGGWSTTNQVKIGSYSYTYTRGTSAVTRYLYAKLTNVDRVGGTMTVSTTFSVPKLTTYTIAYNANGGSGAPSSQTKYYGKNITLSSTKPTRTGYTFQGWGTSESDTSVDYAPEASYSSNAGITLYAIWKANTFTVKYDANGGSGAPANQTKTYGVNLTLSSTKPTRKNYTFQGWGTSASSTTVSYQAGGTYTSNSAITLYAVWVLSYIAPKITYLSTTRCDQNGTTSDEGTYVKVNCNWSTTNSVTGITVTWSSSLNSGSKTISASGTSGSVSEIVGGGELSTEYAYVFTITVSDSDGSTYKTSIVNGVAFVMDIHNNGDGVAFGKPAETSGILESQFDIQANKKLILGKYTGTDTVPTGGIKIHDLRDVEPIPGMFGAQSMNVYFDQGYGNMWKTILSMTGWNAGSYATHELSFNAHSNTEYPDLYHRNGINGEWGEWRKILDKYNFSSYAYPITGGVLNGPIVLKNGSILYGQTTGGVDRSLVQLNASNQAVFGYGGYNASEGASYFDGNAVNIRSKGAVAITSPTAGLNARQYGVNKVLWTGGYYMTAGHTVTLSEGISAQPHGIVLVWSQISDGSSVNSNFVYHFIPKQHVTSFAGSGVDVHLSNSSFTKIASKYIYVNNTTITGHENNNKTGTTSDVTYDNSFWVLRQVIGV